MKKLAVLLILVSLFAFSGVCCAKPHMKLSNPHHIVCQDGKLSFKTTITNDGDEAATVTAITLKYIGLYCDGELWWEGVNRDLGAMAYYLPAGESQLINVNIRGKDIDAHDGIKKIKMKYTVHWGKD